jgi:sialate O-acetylesterase
MLCPLNQCDFYLPALQFTVSAAFNATAEIAASAGFPRIRVAELAQNMSIQVPLEDLSSMEVGWARAGPDSIGAAPWHYLSAVAWFSAREVFLRNEQPEPVGVIVFAWGGTVIEAWMSDSMLLACGEDPSTWANPGKPTPNNFTGSLWNGMVHPLLNMSVDHFVWYQGEQNVELNGVGGAANYSRCFPVMISSWIQQWELRGAQFGVRPFVYVELAGWCEDADGANCSQPVNGDQLVAQLRWAQAANHAAVPNPSNPSAYRALAYDLADPLTKTDPPPYGDIHPRDKQDVGARVARVLLGRADATAPYASGCATSDGASLNVSIASTTGAMWLNTGAFTSGFDWRGADGVWREAAIAGVTGVTVTVSAPSGSTGCTGIRYAWRDDPCCPLSHYPACPRMNCALYDRPPSPAAALDPRLPLAPFSLDVDGAGKCAVP